MIFFHVIFNFSREIITSTVNSIEPLVHIALLSRHSRPGNVSWTVNMTETRSEEGADSHRFPPFYDRFTEIDQIFYSKCNFNEKNFPSGNLKNGLDKCFIRGEWNWLISCLNDSKTQAGKGTLGS